MQPVNNGAVADLARELRGLQPPVLESSSAANVCLRTPISLLLNAASGLRNSVCCTWPRGAKPSLFRLTGGAGALPVLLCILSRHIPHHFIASRGGKEMAWLFEASLLQRQLKCYTTAPPFHLRRIPM